MDNPNIVLVHCHDLGKYLGCYDSAVETPQVDALADSGVRFDRHFVTAPQCSPSRSSLMTGRHPHQNGMLGLAHGNWELHDEEQVLPELLREAGYETHLFGLQHITEYPNRLGYDESHSEEPLTADAPPSVHESARARDVADEFAAMLEDGDHDDPFFASVASSKPTASRKTATSASRASATARPPPRRSNHSSSCPMNPGYGPISPRYTACSTRLTTASAP